ncbi:MAG: amidohydrolase family protein, partial [Gemmatimonadota bacterium]
LVVYPGMIDASGEASFELPEPDTSPRQVPAWSPPRDVQGFRPHLRVADHLTATGSSVSAQREAGIVAAAVHPGDGPAPGRSALLHLSGAADAPRELVLDAELGAVLSLEPAPGVYPSTLFGTMAFHRQQFRNAEHRARRVEAFREDPAGLRPPTWDADYRVLSSLAAGETPAFFRAHTSNDIRRALDLASRAGFEPVILGGREAWKVADLLARRDVPVLVSTDYPEPQRWDPESADSVDADTLPPAVQREKTRLENAYRNAARLEEAGVRFALTSGGGGADLREGVRTAVEYGLSEQAALRAVTAAPAGILGRPSLAHLEPGLSANFVVADGPLFDQETDLLYTFVDGRPQVMRPGDDESGKPPAADATGTWSVDVDSERGEFSGTMTLKQDGSSLSGTFRAEFGEMEVQDGTVSGDSLEMTLSGTMQGEGFQITMSGTVEGDEASGTGSGPFGSFTWEATRTSGPNGGAE